MQLINEQDDLAFTLLDLVEHALEAFLKLAAVLGTRDQRAHIQAEDAAVFQVLGHVAAHDPLGQAFCDGGLADAGLTDQHRVVLAFPGQDADDVADLHITADDRVQLVLLGGGDQIGAVLLKGVVGFLGVVAGDALVAADGGQLLHEFFLRDAELAQQLTGCLAGALQDAEEYMLHADVFVLHLLGLIFGGVQGAVQVARDIDLVGVTAGTRHAGQGGDFLHRGGGKSARVDIHLGQHLGDQPVGLLGKCGQDVLLLHGLVGIFNGKALRTLQSLDGFLGELVHVHIADLLWCGHDVIPWQKPNRTANVAGGGC